MNGNLGAAMGQRLDSLLLPGALCVLAFLTAMLGGAPAWARAAAELAILALLAVWFVAGSSRSEWTLRLPSVFWPLAAILLFAGLQAFARLSVYPPATRYEFWLLLALGGLFLLLHHQFSTEARQERFVTALLFLGFALAVFAIVQKLTFNGKIYWMWALPEGDPFGPFVKRNDYAAWALMLVPLAWVRMVRRHQPREVQLFWGLVLLVLGTSIMFSLSRAGSLLFLLFFPLYALVSRQRSRAVGQRWALAGALGLILVAGAVTVTLDTGRLVQRWGTLAEAFRQPEQVEEYRWAMWRDTLPMIRDHLWLGSGIETYGVLSDSYRSFYSRSRWTHAHNDYLEWLVETGLVGAALAVWFLVALARAFAEKMRLATESRARQLVLGAFLGCVLVLLHSLVDFPLRIPANAALFLTLCALITAPTTGTLHNQSRSLGTRGAPEPVGHVEFRLH